MAVIVNLRAARKRRHRGEKERQAAENRVRFGRTPAEKADAASARKTDEKRLDAHRLEDRTGRDEKA